MTLTTEFVNFLIDISSIPIILTYIIVTKNNMHIINLLSVMDSNSRLPLSTRNRNQRLLPFANFNSSSLAGINVNGRLLL